MLVTMIICTRNRAQQLERVLDTACGLNVPLGLEWELIVVDNGSTDDTPAVISKFAGRLPIRRVPEPIAGLSNARNRGVTEARGRYICWTDDDVLIDPEWLAAYVSAFMRHPDAAVFGGEIEPVPEVPLPQWWQDHQDLLASVLATRDLGPDEVPLGGDPELMPYGANYAVRTFEQRQYLYDPLLGVGPHHKRLGEETEVLTGILMSSTGVWVPSAKVEHLIPAARLTMEYIATYNRSFGETAAYLTRTGRTKPYHPDVTPGIRIMRIPLRLAFLFLKKTMNFYIFRSLNMKKKEIQNFIELNYYRGALDHFLESSKAS